MLHANAALTPRQRLRMARLIVDENWPVARAAEWFQVSWPTAKRWADRYRLAGPDGMTDRSSRPHSSPARTPQPTVRKIVHLRCKRRLGPVGIAAIVGVAASTVHAVLVRCRINRLSLLDRRTGEPVVRYERDRPGELVHTDVKKLGNIPTGGGWRTVGRVQGRRNKTTDGGKGRNRHHNVLMGHAYVHTAIDDHTRLAYAEIHDDETADTAIGFWRRAVAWFATRGVTIERVLSDNGSCYRSRAWRQACAQLGVATRYTRPYWPQTNGKAERFNRTMINEWAFVRPYPSEAARRAALPAWLHTYNHHRPHTALGGQPPITRLTNLSGQYI
ncbi:transposase IS481 family protein [Asanoa ferruginea]|uniref:Transposase IS481 family protein n=1 Tax=Asanoa ferruginea TaxID=53367 RepID=A0A3D9ZJH1_9ACTN|nr:IS481 family transposase [Asanoa ferruginea]REF97528.1 transposase IS481 family protein [Asanoa ferruginea]GIF48183.1 IS481 family transposase [Asanoa ferruginea]